MQKIPKNSSPSNQFKTVFKHLQKCSLFFYYVGGWKNDSFFTVTRIKVFCKTNKIKKDLKWSVQFFLDILQPHPPHTVISNSEKLTYPNMQLYTGTGIMMNKNISMIVKTYLPDPVSDFCWQQALITLMSPGRVAFNFISHNSHSFCSLHTCHRFSSVFAQPCFYTGS